MALFWSDVGTFKKWILVELQKQRLCDNTGVYLKPFLTHAYMTTFSSYLETEFYCWHVPSPINLRGRQLLDGSKFSSFDGICDRGRKDLDESFH